MNREELMELKSNEALRPQMTIKPSNFLPLFEPKRDAYGFTVRPQHLQRFREYGSIYKEEEEERTEKWKRFIEQLVEPDHLGSSDVEIIDKSEATDIEQKSKFDSLVSGERDHSSNGKPSGDISTECYDHEGAQVTAQQDKSRKVQTWTPIRPSLHAIENLMSSRVKKNAKDKKISVPQDQLQSIEEDKSLKGDKDEDHEEEFFENEVTDDTLSASEGEAGTKLGVEPTFFPWKEELEFLVRGGVPRDLRGEIWQAFAGVGTRRVKEYYQSLLVPESDYIGSMENANCEMGLNEERAAVPEKWRKQIEKDLPRTFPGHPALDEGGRNSLRRLLIAYARHNPSVGYCQAMNFFAGLLLLMMPEENAFWTLVGIIDDYFCGYYSEEMIESQVDQLVFEELVRERFPKLINHLDYLGVQVAWLSGPWFLSIFVNILPWESVLRIWDVLLFEGNRVMLFCTSLALMELYGPALVTTKDAGDAITLLQSLAGSTFDSSQLVLTACMGFLAVTEDRLLELRKKHRPTVIEAAEERSRGRVSKDSKSLASKLYSFKHDNNISIEGEGANAGLVDNQMDEDLNGSPSDADAILNSINLDSEVDSVPDLQEQVVWLKVQLCTMLEERRSATLRAEELETALMEMVKLDNRRQLSAKVEQLEQEVAELRQSLVDKKEQEKAMLQVLMRVEQDQKVTEDARIFAEQDAAAQKYAVHMLQEKHEKALVLLSQMEKRVKMAESMLEATLQYEKGQNKAVSSPRSTPESPRDLPAKRSLLSFGLGWRDRNKGKQGNLEESSENRFAQSEGSGQQE